MGDCDINALVDADTEVDDAMDPVAKDVVVIDMSIEIVANDDTEEVCDPPPGPNEPVGKDELVCTADVDAVNVALAVTDPSEDIVDNPVDTLVNERTAVNEEVEVELCVEEEEALALPEAVFAAE